MAPFSYLNSVMQDIYIYIRERENRLDNLIANLRMHSDYKTDEFERVQEELKDILNG